MTKRTVRGALLCAAATLAAAAALPALAAQPPSETKVGELVVRGRSMEETLPLDLSRQGNDIEIVTAATIKDQLYVDASQVLEMQVPGLYLNPQAGPFSYADTSLHGSRSQDVLWLVDGVRVNNRLYSGTLPTDTLPAAMIERVEVLKGGQGVFYGTQATAGVINVVTRGFSATPGGELSIGADDNDSVHLGGYARDTLGDGHKFVLYGSYDQSEGYANFTAYQPSATDRRRGYEMGSLGVKYGYDFSDDLALSLRYQHTEGKVDFLRPTLFAESFNRRDQDIASLNLDYTPDGVFQFSLKAYLHDWDSHIFERRNSLTSPGTTVITQDNLFWGFQDQGVTLTGKFTPQGPLEYNIGYDYQTYDARDESYQIAPFKETVNSVFAYARTSEDFSDRVHLSAGVRHNDTGERSATVWSASGRFDISDAVYIEATGGTAFNLPSAENLFLREPGDTIGNPNLLPEESTSYNVSIGGSSGAFEWQLTGFDRKITNLIDYIDITDPDSPYASNAAIVADFPSTFGNVAGEIRARGWEAEVSARLGEDFTLAVSYAYNDKPRQRVPESFVKASLAWDPADLPYGGSISVLSVGDKIQTTSVGTYGPQNIGNYTVADVAAHLYLDPEDRHHRVGLRIQNVFDETYDSLRGSGALDSGTGTFLYGFRAVPRTVHVNYTYRY